MNTNTGEIADMSAVLKDLCKEEGGDIHKKAAEMIYGTTVPAEAAERLLAKARAEGWKDIDIGKCVGPINGWMWEVLSVDLANQSIQIKPAYKQNSPGSSKRKRAKATRAKRRRKRKQH